MMWSTATAARDHCMRAEQLRSRQLFPPVQNVDEPTDFCQVHLPRTQLDTGSESMRGHIHHRNKRKARIKVLACVMSDNITPDQIPKNTPYKCIRGKVFP